MNRCLILAILFVALATRTYGADIIWVHQSRGGGNGVDAPLPGEGSLTWEDDAWRQLIEGRGHQIIENAAFDDLETLSISDYEATIGRLEAADLVIYSRDTASGDYDDPLERQTWTSGFTTPMLIVTPYAMRGNRWDMVQATGIVDALNPMVPIVTDHPLFAGVALNSDGQIDFWQQLGPLDNIDLIDTQDFGGAEVLAVEAETQIPWIAYWDGVANDGDFYDGSSEFAAGPRLFLSAGSDDDPNTWGEKNITSAGDLIVLNAIAFLTGDAGSIVTMPNDCNVDGVLNAADLACIVAASGPNGLASLLAQTGLLAGDLDGDGSVGFGDFLVLSANFGQPVTSYTAGDVDGDGSVAFGDFLILSANFGKSSNAAAAVPEPSSLALMVPAALLGLAIRRRK